MSKEDPPRKGGRPSSRSSRVLDTCDSQEEGDDFGVSSSSIEGVSSTVKTEGSMSPMPIVALRASPYVSRIVPVSPRARAAKSYGEGFDMTSGRKASDPYRNELIDVVCDNICSSLVERQSGTVDEGGTLFVQRIRRL